MQQYVINPLGYPVDMFILSPTNSPPTKFPDNLKFVQPNSQTIQYFANTPASPISPQNTFPSSPSIPIMPISNNYQYPVGYQFVIASPVRQNIIMSQEKLTQTISSQTTQQCTANSQTCANCQTQMNKSPPNTTINIKVVSPSQTDSVTNVNTNVNNNVENKKEIKSDGDETEEELNEVVEESKDGRWSKRNESVSQRDVPGIDHAYLAMDTEYGFEVVWNEIKLSGGKKFKNQNLHNDEMEIDRVFKNLINLNHSNIVKFHDYWIDKRENDPRIIFITEYMSSGSLKQFLRKAKRTNQSIKKSTWKRWSVQLLTALDYMHKCDPPVVHGDLSCDTIFIQHNGLIKIGSIAPDIVNTHVKTCIDVNKWSRHMHYMAPELKESISGDNLEMQSYNSPVDIYAFGMVALEMFNLEFGGNGDTHAVTPELIKQSIDTLDEKQQDFINKCLQTDPKKRPTAKDLLFHPLLFEVPSLRLFAAHKLIKNHNDSFNDSSFTKPADLVIANTKDFEFKFGQLTPFDVNKYLEDVKNGLYPLIVVASNPSEQAQMSCLSTSSVQSTLSPNSNFSLPSSSSSKSNSLSSSPLQSLSAIPNAENFEQLETISENQASIIKTNNSSNSLLQEQNIRTQSPILVQSQNGANTNTSNPFLSDQNGDILFDDKPSEKRQAQQIDTTLRLDETQKSYTLFVEITFEDRTARLIQSSVNKSDKVNDLADELISLGLVNKLDKEALCKRLGQALHQLEINESESVNASHQIQIL